MLLFDAYSKVSDPGGSVYMATVGIRWTCYIYISSRVSNGVFRNYMTGSGTDKSIAVFSRYAHGICVHKPICRECGRICIGSFLVFYTGYSSGNGNTETREAGPFVYLAFLWFFSMAISLEMAVHTDFGAYHLNKRCYFLWGFGHPKFWYGPGSAWFL